MMDEPEDDYMTAEQACEAGWFMPDEVDELRDLFRHITTPEPGDISNHAAAFTLMENILVPTVHAEGSDAAIRFAWARVKLHRHTLV